MIEGHGDDLYQYANVRMNFSSNICQHADHSALKQHLASRLDLIANYPEPEAWSLERLIAERHGVDPRSVIVTNGVTEAIYLVAQAFAMHHCCMEPTFSEYADAIRMYRSGKKSGRALWLCNPNNPTGEALEPDRVLQLAKENSLLVVDQSYEHYTAVPMLTPRQAVGAGNIVQLHSFTKTYAVPGLRIGYIVAAPRLTRQLRRYLRPWSVGVLAVEAGRFLVEHAQPVSVDLAEAQRLRHLLQSTGAVTVRDTHTNFMLCYMESLTAAQLKDYLVREHGMLIRDASNFRCLTPHHFRVAAQTPPENEALFSALRQYLSSTPSL